MRLIFFAAAVAFVVGSFTVTEKGHHYAGQECNNGKDVQYH